MNITNNTSESVSWFCFNSNDALRLIALASGNLGPSEHRNYTPPLNGTGWYAVRFTHEGGGTEQAVGTIRSDGMITLTEQGGGYVTTSG